jgi:hypothetical protein
MATVRSCAAAALLLALPTALAASANLLVSHYNGNLYSLSLTTSGSTGTLAVKQTVKTCGTMPSWLTLDSASGSLWCTDESTYGSPILTQLSVSASGSMTVSGQAKSGGGDLHSTLYGGSDGKGFIATAE